MKTIIQFQVSQGDTHYIAQGVDVPIVTQAKTLDELAKNIREAVTLHFDGEDNAAFGFVPSPSVLLNFELPSVAHA